MRRPWIFFPLRSAEAGAGSGGGAADAGTAAAGAEAGAAAANAGADASAAAAAATTAPARPDWWPEEQWDAETGKPKLDIGEAIKAKAALDERAGQVPGDAAGYKVELPEGVAYKVNEADPLLGEFRAWAHGAGLTQAQFAGVLALRAKMDADLTAASEAAAAAEMTALGAKAQDRINGATTFLKSMMPADQFEALKGAVTSAKAIEGIETLMSKIAGPVVPGSGATGAPEAISTVDYYKSLFNTK